MIPKDVGRRFRAIFYYTCQIDSTAVIYVQVRGTYNISHWFCEEKEKHGNDDKEDTRDTKNNFLTVKTNFW